jgi:hypothetical protein
VYAAPKLSRIIRKKLGEGYGINILYGVLLSATLILTGIFGGFNVVVVSVLIIGMADGFGFGVQNNYFLSLKYVSSVPHFRALSWLSFLKKFAEMLGPLVFAFVLGFPNRAGILYLGVAFLVFALLAAPFLRPKAPKD